MRWVVVHLRFIAIDGISGATSSPCGTLNARRRAKRRACFRLKMDVRPTANRSAAGRYREPSLSSMKYPPRSARRRCSMLYLSSSYRNDTFTVEITIAKADLFDVPLLRGQF